MTDATTNEPERNPRTPEPDTRPTPGTDASDGDAFRPGFADAPRLPARAAEVDALAPPDDERTFPWSGWRPDEEFGQGDEGFGEDA